jgi:hypothetical protein
MLAMLMLKKTQKAKGHTTAARTRPRVKMGDAMRARGLDEHSLATKLDGLLSSKNEKMRFEVVKECGKFLEAYPAPRPGASQDTVPVQFVTHAPRPEREVSPSMPPEPSSFPTQQN